MIENAIVQAVVSGVIGGIITGVAAWSAISVKLEWLRRDVDAHAETLKHAHRRIDDLAPRYHNRGCEE